jgi:sn-glycerol 3-phosphate transport system permease protein
MHKFRPHIEGWLLLLPAAVLLGTFTHFPAIRSFINSLYTTPRRNRPAKFIGWENYQILLEDDIFLQSLWNNILFALWTIPLSIILALLMALAVNSNLRGRGLLRLIFFSPTILPMIAVANIWLFFYTPGYGLLDQIRSLFGGSAFNWLGSKETVLECLMVVTIWKEAGFFMIFYLAALQQMPEDLREAALIEGANRWQIFWKIMFPLLMPTTLFVLINAIINAFRMVDHVVVMTRGGPDNASSLLLFYIYEVAFKFWDTGYAATLTVVLLLILTVVAIGQFFFMDRKVHYQ